jgi:ribonuclease Z
VQWRTRDGPHVQELGLGELKQKVLEFVPGEKVCYVTDVADNEDNRAALAAFLQDADLVGHLGWGFLR